MQQFYKAKSLNKEVQKKSSSGGIFTILSDAVLENNGAIYGAIMDNTLQVKHIRAVNKSDRDCMRGSKYVYSNVEGIYQAILDDLNAGMEVLVSGTPCMIGGVKAYLSACKANIENLITVEVICHGVASPLFFQNYIKDLEDRYKSKAILCNFRAKKYLGQKQDMLVKFENGKIYHASSTNYDWFYNIYLKNLVLRPSCYNCKYATKERCADISLGDFWNKNDAFENDSLIVVNSQQGEQLLQRCMSKISIQAVEYEEIRQPQMKEPSFRPQSREDFWKVMLDKGYSDAQRQFGASTLKGIIVRNGATLAYFTRISILLKALKNWRVSKKR